VHLQMKDVPACKDQICLTV